MPNQEVFSSAEELSEETIEKIKKIRQKVNFQTIDEVIECAEVMSGQRFVAEQNGNGSRQDNTAYREHKEAVARSIIDRVRALNVK